MNEATPDLQNMPSFADAFAQLEVKYPGLPESVAADRVNLRFGVAECDLRISHGLTQAELGAMVGLQQIRITHIEKGDHSPTLNTVLKFGSIFGMRFTIETDGHVDFVQTREPQLKEEEKPVRKSAARQKAVNAAQASDDRPIAA